jgi:hypothetical protein
MKITTRTSLIAAFSMFIVLAIICSTQFAGLSGAQMVPQNNAGYGGSSGGNYGNSGQQMPYAGSNAGPAAGANAGSLNIQGMDGLQGFTTGQNRLSLAIVPVQQQNNMMGFQVIGFAIASPGSGQAVVYSLSKPLAGVIDPSQNTLQVDFSNLESSIDQAGYVAADQVYNTIRSSPQVTIIDVDMTSRGVQGSQTIFSVSGVNIVPPDGKMQAFSMQQPTQLIIDSQSMRLYMVVFPQMINALSSSYSASYSQVQPVVYVQPITILAPIFVPYLQPFPIFFGFISFNPFFFPSGFRPFPRPHPTGLITPTPHFPTGHPTGLITPTPEFPTGHPTGLLPTGHPTGLLPTGHPTGLLPTDHEAGLLPADHQTGLLPADQQTGLLPADQQTGLLPADNFPSGRITPPSDVRVPSAFNGGGMPLLPASGDTFNMNPGGSDIGNIGSGIGGGLPSFGAGAGTSSIGGGLGSGMSSAGSSPGGGFGGGLGSSPGGGI